MIRPIREAHPAQPSFREISQGVRTRGRLVQRSQAELSAASEDEEVIMRVPAIRSLWLVTGLCVGACASGDENGGQADPNSLGGGVSTNSGVPTSGEAGIMGLGDDGGLTPDRLKRRDAAAGDANPISAFEAGTQSGSSSGALGSEAGAVVATRDSGSPKTVTDSSAAPAADSGPAATVVDSGGTSGQVPTIGGCAIFPADNPWNTRIDDPQAYPVHPSSDTYIANMSPSTHLHADWGDWSTDHYGIPWQVVPGSQAMVPMTFDYADESDPGPYPFPPNALVEGGAGSGGDMHVLVIDTGNCALYETWNSTYVGPGWHCGSGAKFDLTSNALRPDGWTSADAAGLPVLAGLVRLSEVQAGAIQHALRFTVSSTQQGFIHPATHAAGKSNTSLPPMGLRLRLKGAFDASAFTGAAKVILTAMKQYGLILADNGSNWYVTGDSDDGWSPLMDGITQALSQVHGSDFEAVYTGPILQ